MSKKESIWNISNGLSVLRILMVIPASYYLLMGTQSSHMIAFVLIVVGASTDYFDGYFARKYSQITDFGRIIDPLADKVAIGVLVVILLIRSLLPLWFVLSILVRDILIFTGGMYVQKSKGIVLQSNWLGKWTAGVLSILVAVTVLNIEELALVKELFIYGSTIMLILSTVSYTRRFLQIS